MDALSSKKLRVGVVLDDVTVAPNWIHSLLEQVIQSHFAELSLVIHNAHQPDRATLFSRLRSPGAVLFAAYRKIDYKVYRRKAPNDALRHTEIESLLVAVETLTVSPVQVQDTDHLEASDVEAIKARQLDVILQLGSRILKGEVLSAATYGIWSFQHDHCRFDRLTPANTRQIAECHTESGNTVCLLAEDSESCRLMYRSVSHTCPRSLFLNRNASYWKSTHFLFRRLKKLHHYGREYIESAPRVDRPLLSSLPGRAPATVRQVARSLLSTATCLAKAQYRSRLFNEQWYVAISKRQADIMETIQHPQFQVIPCPPDRFLADPFVIHHGGLDYVFVEEYSFSTRKGIISVIAVNEAGELSDATPVLERPYHLSYPFVFKQGNAYYMIPEAGASRQVELYKSYNFPFEWRLEQVLLKDIDAADPTLYQKDGLFWLFVNIAAPGVDYSDELHLFYATSLTGEWTPNKLNPVITHAGHARPAGRLFTWNGKLLRPAQNCLQHYGHSMVLMEITALTPETYQEKDFYQITPAWLGASLCTHSLNFNDNLLVCDGQRYIRKSHPFKRKGRAGMVSGK